MCELQQLCAVAGSQLSVISFQLTAFTFCIRDYNIRGPSRYYPFGNSPLQLFIPIDPDERRIWLVRPYISSREKVLLDV
jgi:hypothetical protein